MLSSHWEKIKNPQSVFNAVMSQHIFYEKGKEYINNGGKKILAEWGKIHGVSFKNPKYLQTWKEEQAEKWNLGNPLPKRKKHVLIRIEPAVFDSHAKEFCVACGKKIWQGNYAKSGNYCYPSCV